MTGSYHTSESRLITILVVGYTLLSLAACESAQEPPGLDEPATPQFARNVGPQVTTVDLGAGESRGVNDAGQVVIQTGMRSFLWADPDGIGTGSPGARAELPPVEGYTSFVEALNNAPLPHVVGDLRPVAPGQNRYAARWAAESTNPPTFRGPEQLDTAASTAHAVNDLGDVAGAVSASGCPPDEARVGWYGALWTASGRTIICPLGEPFNHSSVDAEDINNAGFIVGASYMAGTETSPASYRAFLRRSDGRMIALPPYQTDALSYAWAVSDVVADAMGIRVVHVAGESQGSGRRPVRWTVNAEGDDIQIRGPVPVATSGWARGVHNAGHVAGTTTARGGFRAFFWNAVTGQLLALQPLGHDVASLGRGGVNRGTAPGSIYVAGQSQDRYGTNVRAVLWTIMP